MSWSKFNDSFNSLKGQLSTFVQETLVPEDEEETEETQGEDDSTKLSQLASICAAQEDEIESLRKQVATLRQQNSTNKPNAPENSKNPTVGGGSVTEPQSPFGGVATPAGGLGSVPSQTLEDSWFWEPDKNSSSSASSTKTTGGGELTLSKSPSGSDLTVVLLRDPTQQLQQSTCKGTGQGSASASVSDDQLKKLTLENAVLREKNQQLAQEVRETSENIEELDKQHNLIMETILGQKSALQSRCDTMTEELEKLSEKFRQMADAKDARIAEMSRDIGELSTRREELTKEVDELREQERQRKQDQDQPEESFVEVERETKELQLQEELTNLRVEKRKIEEDFVAGQEDFLTVQREFAAYKTQFNEELLREAFVPKSDLLSLLNDYRSTEKKNECEAVADPIAELKNLLEAMTTVQRDKESYESLEKKFAALSTQFQQAVEERRRIAREKETLQADLINYEIECAELLKNNEKLLEELEQTKCGKLETIPEHSEENFTVLEKECVELSDTVRRLEADRSRLEELVQQLEFQVNEMRSKERVEGDGVSVEEAVDKEGESNVSEQQVNEESRRVAELEGEIMETRNQMEILQNILTTANEKLESAQEKIRELEVAKEQDQLSQKECDKQRRVEFDEMLQEKQSFYDKELNEKITTIESLVEEKQSLKQALEQLKAETDAQVAAYDEQLNEAIKKRGEEDVDTISAAIAEYKMKLDSQTEEVAQLNAMLTQLTQEKNDLIALVTAKHQESIQYHAEVQRLGALLQHAERDKEVAREKACESCGALQAQVEELQRRQVRLEELERGELDQVQFLKEKTSILTSNLLVEQNLKKLLQKEKEELEKDLDRLRQHLMALEEEHTGQLMELQRQMEEYRVRAMTIESEAKHASTTYTSASIRANQQNETLQAQYKLLQQQRDDLSARLSLAEDRESKNAAALVNLQCALEQFQREKQRDVEDAMYLVKKEVIEEKQRFANLTADLQATQVQLNDAKAGLLAAARISDQLEGSQRMVADQKEEIASLNTKLARLEEKWRVTEESHSDKVEKGLIKNLIIGYLTAPNSGRGQILKLISAVLEFSQTEEAKVGVNKNQSGWLGGLLHSNDAAAGNEGLAQAFVKFLEQESSPNSAPTEKEPALLTMMSNSPSGGLTSPVGDTVGQPSENSVAAPIVHPQPTLSADATLQQNFVPTRNSSSILKDVLNDS